MIKPIVLFLAVFPDPASDQTSRQVLIVVNDRQWQSRELLKQWHRRADLWRLGAVKQAIDDHFEVRVVSFIDVGVATTPAVFVSGHRLQWPDYAFQAGGCALIALGEMLGPYRPDRMKRRYWDHQLNDWVVEYEKVRWPDPFHVQKPNVPIIAEKPQLP